jgi:hypothetical protein
LRVVGKGGTGGDGPPEGEIKGGALVAVDGDPFGPVLAGKVGAVEVHEAGVVHPHAVVGVGGGAVEDYRFDNQPVMRQSWQGIVMLNMWFVTMPIVSGSLDPGWQRGRR